MGQINKTSLDSHPFLTKFLLDRYQTPANSKTDFLLGRVQQVYVQKAKASPIETCLKVLHQFVLPEDQSEHLELTRKL